MSIQGADIRRRIDKVSKLDSSDLSFNDVSYLKYLLRFIDSIKLRELAACWRTDLWVF